MKNAPALLFAAALWAAPALADNYPRQNGIDIQHYIFRVTLSDDTDEISGEATVEIKFLRDGVSQITLDLTNTQAGKGMTVTAVTRGGAAVRYTHTGDRLTLQTAGAKVEDRVAYTVAYHGVAANGLHIAKNRFGDRTFFSWNWPVLARQWLPVLDHPYDKATSEWIVTAPSKYQVVANGALVEETDLGDGRRRTHWKESVPIAVWLNNIGVAQFAVRHFGSAAGVPLSTWVFPQDRANGITTFEEPMRQAIDFFTSHIGPYPYEKLDGVQVNGMGGGMEHASAIFYGERSLGEKPAFSLVAHEVSHQWWGDSVTEKDWDDAWLSEGFATYFANLAAEHYQGHDVMVEALRRSRASIFQMEQRTPDVAIIHDNLPEISNGRAPVGLVYQKGGWTLHMLRGAIGTAAFWSGIREYYRTYRDGSASTADLRQAMEKASGKDLGWFFEQWLSRAGSPKIAGTWSYDAQGKKLRLEMTQTQPGGAFRLPMDIGLRAAGQNMETTRIEMTAKTQQFEIPAAREPEVVELDPGVWVLLDAKLSKR